MSTSQGFAGSGNRHYETGEIPSVLRGVLASEQDNPVYPMDYCEKCIAEGVSGSDTCFHRHWERKK